jgi:hypothetical protein
MLAAMSSARWTEIDNRRAYLHRAVVNAAHDRRRSTQRRLNRELRAADVEPVESVYVDRDVIRALRRLTVSQAPDGTRVLADDDGETVFALAISVYPDGCTGAPDCASSSDEEQMDAIFAALAGPLSPES